MTKPLTATKQELLWIPNATTAKITASKKTGAAQDRLMCNKGHRGHYASYDSYEGGGPDTLVYCPRCTF
jgi:hypothetical protein